MANGATEVVNYTKLIRPSTIRTSYWHYFGFPADNFGNILTRKHIICTECKQALLYSKNTANLKLHLQNKHPDIWDTLNTTNGNPPTKSILTQKKTTPPTPTSIKKAPGQQQQHILPQLDTSKQPAVVVQPVNIGSTIHYSETDYLVDQLTENDLIDQDQGIIEYLIPDDPMEEDIVLIDRTAPVMGTSTTEQDGLKSELEDMFDEEPYEDVCEENSTIVHNIMPMNNIVITTHTGHSLPSTSLSLTDYTEFCIEDLLSPSIVEGTGFIKMMNTVKKGIYIPSASTVYF